MPFFLLLSACFGDPRPLPDLGRCRFDGDQLDMMINTSPEGFTQGLALSLEDACRGPDSEAFQDLLRLVREGPVDARLEPMPQERIEAALALAEARCGTLPDPSFTQPWGAPEIEAFRRACGSDERLPDNLAGSHLIAASTLLDEILKRASADEARTNILTQVYAYSRLDSDSGAPAGLLRRGLPATLPSSHHRRAVTPHCTKAFTLTPEGTKLLAEGEPSYTEWSRDACQRQPDLLLGVQGDTRLDQLLKGLRARKGYQVITAHAAPGQPSGVPVALEERTLLGAVWISKDSILKYLNPGEVIFEISVDGDQVRLVSQGVEPIEVDASTHRGQVALWRASCGLGGMRGQTWTTPQTTWSQLLRVWDTIFVDRPDLGSCPDPDRRLPYGGVVSARLEPGAPGGP